MDNVGVLNRGRTSFDDGAWAAAYANFRDADGQQPLDVDDLNRCAIAAYLVGADAASMELLGRAYQSSLDREDHTAAARAAFWAAFRLLTSGETAQAGGWLARADRALADGPAECAERGFLLVPQALQHLFGGQPDTASELFGEAARIGERFGEPDLIALGRMGEGQSLVAARRSAEGIALLDEVMVAVIAGTLSPIVSGLVYCVVISSCQDVLDIGRAQQWTAALERWTDSQPDLVPYRGQCLVHRSQLMQMQGAWPDAMRTAERAVALLCEPPPKPSSGMAFYQKGELHRLRGEVAAAEDCYREANHVGHEPQPGLSLLRLAQRQVPVARAAVQRAVNEASDATQLIRLLPAYVEIALAAGDVEAASDAADRLGEIAAALGGGWPQAIADHARGAVLLASGDPAVAVQALRRARAAWREIEAPYDAARTAELIGRACRELGDDDSARMDFEAAAAVFRELGATADLARVDGASGRAVGTPTHGLTPREVEVLRLVAAGKSNRAIATELVLSEKTVARHVSNIFGKLDLGSRSAATAFAYEHDLV